MEIDSNRFLEEMLHKKEEELKAMQEILLELRNKYEELKKEYQKLGDIICGNNRKDNWGNYDYRSSWSIPGCIVGIVKRGKEEWLMRK